ncbi:DUF1187 family protein [Symbiopectobacterium purcellii]|uniref:DUF1187 family protein n=1 Tax=Symbiopectobacterium purcellii TaxID=2871826 RepID=UPI003F8726F7
MNQNGCSINSQVGWPNLVDHYTFSHNDRRCSSINDLRETYVQNNGNYQKARWDGCQWLRFSEVKLTMSECEKLIFKPKEAGIAKRLNFDYII